MSFIPRVPGRPMLLAKGTGSDMARLERAASGGRDYREHATGRGE